MKPQRISSLVLLLSIICAISVSISFAFIQFYAGQKIDLALYLGLFFVTFIVTFLVIYFIYNHILFSKIEKINSEIKKILPQKEIPDVNFSLEEIDALTELEQEVKKIISDRAREIEHLSNIESYRKEFLGNVSHELKTPVFNIQGFVSTLIDGGINDPEINIEYLKRADKSIERIIHIIDDLETITQLETGSLELEFEKYDVMAQIKDIIAQLDLNAKKKSISIQLIRKSDKPLYVSADKFRIRQVFVNLITNSIKYGIQNGRTDINLNLYNNEVIVEVKDNGIGVKEEHVPRLFERFYRVDKGRSREQGGTGLGLAIVKHIIEAHKKTISVKSAPDEGTTFTFTLDRA